MSAQNPEDPKSRALGPRQDGQPVDPSGVVPERYPAPPAPYEAPPAQPPQQGYPPHGYQPAAYPPNGYPQQGYPPYGYPPAAYPPYVQQSYTVAPKSPGLALLAAFFLPGLGSMINGEVGKGIGILIGYLVSWALTFVFIGFVGIVAFWIWGMVDGYNGARLWNARHGIVS